LISFRNVYLVQREVNSKCICAGNYQLPDPVAVRKCVPRPGISHIQSGMVIITKAPRSISGFIRYFIFCPERGNIWLGEESFVNLLDGVDRFPAFGNPAVTLLCS